MINHVWPIFRDHLCPYRYGVKRQFNVKRFGVLVGLPVAFGVALSFVYPEIQEKHQGTYLAVYAIVASVMIGLIPVTQNLVGLADTGRRYDAGERPLFRQQVIRLQVLRELYAELAFVVVLLVASFVPILLAGAASFPGWLKQCISAFAYSVGAAVALAFLRTVAGIYLVLDVQAHEVNKKLNANAPQSASPHVTDEEAA
jgi:hypothetical protein